MMIGDLRWPPVKGPILGCSRPQRDDDDGTGSPPMNAAFAGKDAASSGSALPQRKREGSSVVECRLRTEILLYWSCLGPQGRKTKRLALMIVIVKTARSTKTKRINKQSMACYIETQ